MKSAEPTLVRSWGRAARLLLCAAALAACVCVSASAQCPTIDNIGWARGETVRFFLDANLNGEQKRQIRWALAEWNRANGVNNARVRFEEDFTGGNFRFRFANGTLPTGVPGFAQKQFGPDGVVVSATLTYDPAAVFPGTSTLIANPSAPGYETFLIKLTLHEVGHTMGLDHPANSSDICAQPDGASVMNYICNVNDSANNMPTRVTAACDQSAINAETRYFPFNNVPNLIEDSQFFVRQHYLGWSFWTNNIESCGADAGCRSVKRIDTSAAFFLSPEFQQTGYFVYRVYKVAFGNIPGKPVPVTIQEFLPETEQVARGVIGGQAGWEQRLEENRQAWAAEITQRPRFLATYPLTISNAQLVDANAGGVLSQAERDSLVARLDAGQATRGQALAEVAADADLRAREFNRAFVLMEYFGYLRRNPDDAPNTDFSGYDFWLGKLNQFGGDYVAAEMVKAFITSEEYRRRFGRP
jgi:hypothetical protein